MNHQIAVVTGGAGFIGSHMVDLLLAQGYEVRVIDNLLGGHEKNFIQHANNPNFHFEQLDILKLQPDSVLFKQAQYVFHFAGIGDIVPSIEEPLRYMETNVLGTVHVLQAARAAKVKKLVYAASSSCYGLAATPTNELHCINPQYPYALSKYQGECAAFHWNQVYRLPVNSVRIFNAYGTRVRTTGAYGAVFGVFLKQKLLKKPYTVVGDGTQSRDFLYVTDVANAFLAAAETDLVGKVWNIGAGKPQSINYLVDLLSADSTYSIDYLPRRPGEPECTWADLTKITTELGWHPEVMFADGVQKMLAEIHHWQDAPLWDKGSIATATETWFEYLS